ncbi:hypothetical protein BDV95DRAFT_512251 [Massariosphaeria phaeospora]|uniref:FAD-binding FR-type domain-containing protein n=1 Tax=Massariosphaeria phaeospora TaxID=100035 RepID=A0A7C8MFA6_9PLEO|nr:hypothetical protein BDV95DRAFT_512251 [Massariosphaeria phaeospora]
MLFRSRRTAVLQLRRCRATIASFQNISTHLLKYCASYFCCYLSAAILPVEDSNPDFIQEFPIRFRHIPSSIYTGLLEDMIEGYDKQLPDLFTPVRPTSLNTRTTMDDLDQIRHQNHIHHRRESNKRLSQLLWLAIAATVAVRVAQRSFNWWSRRCHRKQQASRIIPFYIHNSIDRVCAYFTALWLFSVPRPIRSTSKSPVTLGRLFSLTAYTCIIAALLVSVDAPSASPKFIDDVAFRAAWITLAQLPLVHFLATKRGPLNLLAAVSYERISWLHRWMSRVLFLSASIHMAIKISSISISDAFQSQEKVGMMIRYGLGAYALLAWIILTNILPLRQWSYWVFYLNHSMSTLVLLWVMFKHVPKYARTPIYMAASIIIVDTSMCLYTFLWNNVSIQLSKRRFAKFRKGPTREVLSLGYPIKMIASHTTDCSIGQPEATTVIRISDVPFSWRPGQHVRLYIPKLGLMESHPFTPATCSEGLALSQLSNEHSDLEAHSLLSSTSTSVSNDMLFFVRSHSGLTLRLAQYHARWLSAPCPNSTQPSTSLTAFVDGPYGTPPAWEEYESLVLLVTSTGVSFALSVLGYFEQLCFEGQQNLPMKRIRFIWVVRHIEPQLESTVTSMLTQHSSILMDAGISISAKFHVTCPSSKIGQNTVGMPGYDPFAHLRQPQKKPQSRRTPLRIRNPNATIEEDEDMDAEEEAQQALMGPDPQMSELDSRSSFESGASSTLLGEDDMCGVSDLDATIDELETSCWSRTTFCNTKHNQAASSFQKSCQCRMLQLERQKTAPKSSRPEFIVRSYGSRPNLPHILSSLVPTLAKERTMIALCANRELATEAKNVVAIMNLDFALGRRERGVEIFTESFT